jgi:hypothetical protein
VSDVAYRAPSAPLAITSGSAGVMCRMSCVSARLGCVRAAGLLGLVMACLSLVPAPAGATTIAPSTTADVVADDGQCALREAVNAANDDASSGAAPGECAAGSGADVIELEAARYELVPGIPLDMSGELTVRGVNGRASVVDGNGGSDCDGARGNVIDVDAGSEVRLRRLAVTGGRAECGENVAGGGNAGDGASGGGIVNLGILVVEKVSVLDNWAGRGGDNYADPGDGGNGGHGGGIYTEGRLTVSHSTIASNHAGDGGCTPTRLSNDGGKGGSGGGIYATAGADVKILDSTVADNSAGDARGNTDDPSGPCQDPDNGSPPGGSGGGVSAAGPLEVRHSTLAANQAGEGSLGTAPGAAVSAPGGTLYNTVVANHQGGDPHFGACEGVADGGHNLKSPEGDAQTCPGATADPVLRPLQNNGGPTDTMALGAGSPAIDAIPATGAGCTPRDQRGVARPQGPGCDIGAFEVAAGTAKVEDGQPVFRAGPGVENAVSVSYASGAFVIEDASAPIEPGPGCTALTGDRVSCPSNAPAARVEVYDRDDSATVSQRGCSCFGGSGADTLTGGQAVDRLIGGAGNDLLAGGHAADVLDGEAGVDTATYAGRTSRVVVTLDPLPNDGNASDGPIGARDWVQTENVTGGDGDDSLTGAGGANVLGGEGGADTLTGRGGPDTLVGGAGTDTASYVGRRSGVSVTLDGQPNDGNASDGPTIARDDADVESVAGGEDGDTLDLRDGLAGWATCGGGADRVLRDPADRAAADCETVTP